jgi:hypothetical protein
MLRDESLDSACLGVAVSTDAATRHQACTEVLLGQNVLVGEDEINLGAVPASTD